MCDTLRIVRCEDAADLPLPQYMTKQAAGMDLYANVHEPTPILPGEYKLIPTGIKIALPENYEGQIRPRSGLALKHGLTMLNSPGTIDADYRGEIKVILINLGKETFIVERGMRIAQMVISKVYQLELTEVNELDETQRNDGGFGHTKI